MLIVENQENDKFCDIIYWLIPISLSVFFSKNESIGGAFDPIHNLKYLRSFLPLMKLIFLVNNQSIRWNSNSIGNDLTMFKFENSDGQKEQGGGFRSKLGFRLKKSHTPQKDDMDATIMTQDFRDVGKNEESIKNSTKYQK